MTAATVFIVSSPAHPFIAAHARSDRAEASAKAIGAEVAPRSIEVGDRVSFTFHGHPRSGRVVKGDGSSRIDVRFTQGTTGNVVKTISVDKVTGIR